MKIHALPLCCGLFFLFICYFGGRGYGERCHCGEFGVTEAFSWPVYHFCKMWDMRDINTQPRYPRLHPPFTRLLWLQTAHLSWLLMKVGDPGHESVSRSIMPIKTLKIASIPLYIGHKQMEQFCLYVGLIRESQAFSRCGTLRPGDIRFCLYPRLICWSNL